MLIGITGKAGSGKDTFAKYFIDNHNFTRYAFAGPIKRMIEAGFGLDPGVWDDREKKEQELEWLGRSPRYLAQTIGTEWGRDLVHPDLWLLLAEQARANHQHVIITDVRFDNEAEWIRAHDGLLIEVAARSMDVDNNAHASEKGVNSDFLTMKVRNDGTIIDLYEKAHSIWCVWGDTTV